MPKGNPNPSPETRFGAENGNPINLAGKTSAQRENEYKAAEISASLRAQALSLMQEKVAAGADLLEMIDANALKLFKDSEDRAHGTPKQSVDHTTDGQPITPVTGLDVRIVDAPPSDADTPAG